MSDVLTELIDDYIERHKETLELLSIPGFYDNLIRSSEEFHKRKGHSLDDARKALEG